ncbi:MAG: kinase [Alphaproteobacteria bacterium]|nr:kinase [Alphaproteobacteria bacterium]
MHPAVRESLKFLGFNNAQGVEIHHQGDLPARTGIGSSSSFSVGLINALTSLQGGFIDKKGLAEKAVHLERDILRETGGVQDQYAAAYGGFNRITFSKEGVTVTPVTASRNVLNELSENLVLVYTGSSRFSSEVSKSIVTNLNQKESYLRLMVQQVDTGEKLIKNGSLDEFGKLLGEGWKLKKELSGNMTTPEIDEIYSKGIEAGALGGKLIGGGSAGFVLFYVPRSRQMAFREVFKKLIKVFFKIDWDGSTLIYKEPSKSLGGSATLSFLGNAC